MNSEIRQPEFGPTKLRININEGLLEVEGREEFTLRVYEDFKEFAARVRPVGRDAKAEQQTSNGAVKSEATRQPRKQKSSAEEPHFLKDLDLAAKNGSPSLREYYAKFTPKWHFERNLIFVAYLQNVAEVAPITANHVYTCYRRIQEKAPKRFRQSLIDTGNKKDWLITNSLEDLKLSVDGLNYLEHDMPRAG